jgi:glycerol kinase
MSSYIIAIDQGTTSTRVCIFDDNGRLVNQAQKEFSQLYPKPGWVEHNPEEIWQSTLVTLKEATSKIDKTLIKTIGITNQRETVVVWDAKSWSPIHPAIVWQCRRTQDACQKIKKKKLDRKIYKETGLIVDPYFSATKIQWILKNTPGAMARAKRGELRLGTIDTFLLWRLSAGKSHGTDVSNASRTMLMNLKTRTWSKDLLKLFQIPTSMLPEIRPSNSLFGVTSGLGFLPDGIPIHGILGDQQSALFGQLAHSPGDAKCTFGTGSFILLNTGEKIVFSKHKLLTTVAWQLEGQETIYALEGGAFICGAAIQWLRDGLGLIKTSEEVEELASKVTSSEGVQFVPALVGLGAPIWNPEARGMISGITRGTQKHHLAFATLEAMALQNVDILTAMEKDLDKSIRQLKVDGGAARNNLLMQLQSDYLGRPVDRPVIFETTALGAALMAGLGAGVFKTIKDLQKKWLLDRQFRPKISQAQRHSRQKKWQKALIQVQA